MKSVIAIASVGWAMLAVTTRADPPPAVATPATAPPATNLLRTVPTVVAVSSTVANPTILPRHLVDGKLDTAWNSQTGELVGAWVGVRLPAAVTVDAIKLTVGFTKVDPRWGDLFTMNPRIKRVRVTRDDKLVVEQTLDPTLRTLQTIAIDALPGGDYKLSVLEIVPGTKADWREVNISELEVWGQAGSAAAAGAGAPTPTPTPIVRVGAFDPDPLDQSDCMRLMLPDAKAKTAGAIVHFDTVDLDGDRTVCQLDHVAPDAPREPPGDRPIATVMLAIVDRHGARPVVIARLPELESLAPADPQLAGMDPTHRKRVELATLAWTTSETLLRVDAIEGEGSPMFDGETTTSQLYRVTATGATKILELSSSVQGSVDSGHRSVCTLEPIAPAAQPPATLRVSCHDRDEAPGADPGHRMHEADHVIVYRWNGTTYVARP